MAGFGLGVFMVCLSAAFQAADYSFYAGTPFTHNILQSQKSCLKLVFATLMQTSERWHNVRMSDVEVAMLKQLRRHLGFVKK
jgi:hypothetical protein